MKKYRGKRVDNGEWVYGYLIGTDVIVGEIVEFTEEYFNCEWWCRVDPKTVGQSTGLKDKNRREIYEGDIVLVGNHKQPAIVEYDEGCFYTPIGISRYRLGWWQIDAIEVIGNIYEHPELAEV